MFRVRALAAVLMLAVASGANAQRIEIPAMPAGPVMGPAAPTVVIPPPPPPPPPLGADLHVHVPQQCCHDVCMPDAACQPGYACPQRCNRVCVQC